jgi:hypothetical protein
MTGMPHPIQGRLTTTLRELMKLTLGGNSILGSLTTTLR